MTFARRILIVGGIALVLWRIALPTLSDFLHQLLELLSPEIPVHLT